MKGISFFCSHTTSLPGVTGLENLQNNYIKVRKLIRISSLNLQKSTLPSWCRYEQLFLFYVIKIGYDYNKITYIGIISKYIIPKKSTKIQIVKTSWFSIQELNLFIVIQKNPIFSNYFFTQLKLNDAVDFTHQFFFLIFLWLLPQVVYIILKRSSWL